MNKEELLDRIRKIRNDDDEQTVQLCDELIEIARKDSDKAVLGLALYYKGEAIYFEGDKAINCLKEAAELLEEDSYPEELARTYNILGILTSHAEDFSTSINYYIKARNICERHDYKYVAGLCCSNAGFLFQTISDYNKSIEYYQLAADYFSNADSFENVNEYVATLKANIFNCIYYLRDNDRLRDYYNSIKELADFIEPSFVKPLFDAIYYQSIGDSENMKDALERVVELSFEGTASDHYEYIDNYEFLCDYLYDNSFFEKLEQILAMLERELPQDKNPRIQIKLTKYKMACLEHTKDFQGYIEASKQYVRLYETITAGYHRTIQEALNLQVYVEDLQGKTDGYKLESLTDSLTGLLNKKGINELGAKLLEEAKASACLVATFIMDIDFFKQYNDRYGHVLGDECLKKVAEVIKKNTGLGDLAGRFGGDEFVIVCRNADKAKASSIAEAILTGVRELMIESVNSPIADTVTVTIGVHAAVPHSGTELTRLIDLADKKLYEAKKAGKNCYR